MSVSLVDSGGDILASQSAVAETEHVGNKEEVVGSPYKTSLWLLDCSHHWACMKICEWNCSKRTCKAAFGDFLHTELVNPGVEHIAGAVILDSWDQVRLSLHADRETKFEFLDDALMGIWQIVLSTWECSAECEQEGSVHLENCGC